MTKLYCWIMSGLKSEEGATMVEYGLMVAFIAVVVGVAAEALGGGISRLFGEVNANLPAVPGP